MTVDAPMMRLGRSLQKKHGECYASEAGWRSMLLEDTGHAPGVGTIPAALDRLFKLGECRAEWLYGGGILPTGEKCDFGTRLVRWANDRHERRAFAKQYKFLNRGTDGRRHGTYRRPDPRAVDQVAEQRRAIQKSLEPPPATLTAGDVARIVDESKARLEALFGPLQAPPKKPPD